MKPGKIVLLPFPFADANFRKIRPALVIGKTADRYNDLIVCAISSSIPDHLTKADIIVLPTPSNQLRVESCIKTDRIATIRET
jgi:mRNA-degrading endonuclease toxin of MazEF toxin-antitoxin module